MSTWIIKLRHTTNSQLIKTFPVFTSPLNSPAAQLTLFFTNWLALLSKHSWHSGKQWNYDLISFESALSGFEAQTRIRMALFGLSNKHLARSHPGFLHNRRPLLRLVMSESSVHLQGSNEHDIKRVRPG